MTGDFIAIFLSVHGDLIFSLCRVCVDSVCLIISDVYMTPIFIVSPYNDIFLISNRLLVICDPNYCDGDR